MLLRLEARCLRLPVPMRLLPHLLLPLQGSCYKAAEGSSAPWACAGQTELVAALCAAATTCLALADAAVPPDSRDRGVQRHIAMAKAAWAKEQLGKPETAGLLLSLIIRHV